MRKIIESPVEAEKLVTHLITELDLESKFKVGLAGSYVRDEHKASSKIDLVLKARNQEGLVLVGKWVMIDQITEFMVSNYHNKYNIIWLDLLEKDTEKTLEYMRDNGMELNPECVYTNIVEEVKWMTEPDIEPETEEDEEEGAY